ncbi:LAME_0H19130g1_1 [Lachancea meyersii CBS 8951]|uniref:LAME_0H19130g1_1 n=1 Tax=Lachancea meyersii CBS 8951 TaxID=1266667 RepID=A0A1G4KJ29_9SACH|nr:LAME_0H19130g1_1 [Lachancea meyersii CBS 8951]
MKSFITSGDIPIGYVTPKFPSLFWPINNKKYTLSYLYYITDIWKYTVYWTLILFMAFYVAAGLWASFSHRKTAGGLWIMIVYILAGGFQALAAGTVSGLMLAVTYKAGLFAMSTWIPLCFSVVLILFHISTTYSMAGVII